MTERDWAFGGKLWQLTSNGFIIASLNLGLITQLVPVVFRATACINPTHLTQSLKPCDILTACYVCDAQLGDFKATSSN